jgi:heptosyltransferase-2
MMTNTTFRTIGVWQTAYLGDSVLTLPLLQALAEAYPAARIHFFVRRGLSGLYAGLPYLAGVHEFDKRGAQGGLSGAWLYGKTLRPMDFDLWISSHRSLRSALVAKAVGAPVRIGYSTPWFNRLAYTKVIDRRFGQAHEIERLNRLLIPLGITAGDNWPRFTPPAKAMEDAARFWREHGLDDQAMHVIGLHPGSVWPTKRWPATHYASLLDLAVEHGLRVIVFAGPGEESVAAQVMAEARHGTDKAVINLSGKLNLPALAAYLARLSVYVSNDSGPMHLAWAQHVPIVALFGPTVERFGFYPMGSRSRVLEVDLDCRPCGLHGHQQCPKDHHECMVRITPEQAWQAVRQVLAKEGV